MNKEDIEALIRDRNTWARRLADMRDERDSAIEQAEMWRSRCGELDNERTTLQIKIEDAHIKALESAASDWMREGKHILFNTRSKDAAYKMPHLRVRDWLIARVDKIRDGLDEY